MSQKPGRKIGKLRVTLDRQVSRYKRASTTVELRIDDTGLFWAEHDGEWYKAYTQAELEAQLKKAIDKTINLEWTRYIVVDYSANAWPLNDAGRPNTSGYHISFDLARDRAELADPDDGQHIITGISLKWDVFEYSNSYALPEDKKKIVRMSRAVHEDGSTSSVSEESDDALPDGAVLWTAEREAFLRTVLEALGRLDAKMVELFRGAPDELAKKLDEARFFSADRLLGPGKAPTQPKTRKRPTQAPGSDGGVKNEAE